MSEKPKRWKKGDVAQVKNIYHPWNCLLVIVAKVMLHEVEAYTIILNENSQRNNSKHEIFRKTDLEYIGQAYFVEQDKKPEPVGLYQGLPQGEF